MTFSDESAGEVETVPVAAEAGDADASSGTAAIVLALIIARRVVRAVVGRADSFLFAPIACSACPLPAHAAGSRSDFDPE
jgi:hypothetical protein